jgi:hypothetical protein
VAAHAAEVAPGVHFEGQFLVSVRGTSAAPLQALTARGWKVETLATTRTTPPKTWLLVTPPGGRLAAASSMHAWELAHRMVGGKAPAALGSLDGIDLSSIIEIEPHAAYEISGFHDRYTTGMKQREESAPQCASPSSGVIACGKASIQWPNVTKSSWHLDDDRTELRKAQLRAESAFGGPKLVRIAHLDTGYYPSKDSITPPRFRTDLSRSMIPDDQCGETGIDCYVGGTPNGHGPETLSVLAGGKVGFPGGNGYPPYDDYMGGAPLAEVFTLRVSPSVVLLYPLHVGQGIFLAVDQDADVISMSMGGAPSYFLRDAVNSAYESGVPMFFAAADFLRLPVPLIPIEIPPHTMAYPARFNTATPVSGITASGKSYGLNPSWFLSVLRGDAFSWILRGSYGPTKLMAHRALTTYTPNVTARFGQRIVAGSAPPVFPPNQIHFGFAGTSAATPQAAAAAALWLQFHRNDFNEAEWRSWVKAQSAYDALTSTAELPKQHGVVDHFGAGVVKADKALDYAKPANPVKREPGEIGVDWITILADILGIDTNEAAPKETAHIHKAMMQLEVAQLLMTEPQLRDILKGDFETTPSEAQIQRLARALENHPRASAQLKKGIKSRRLRRS